MIKKLYSLLIALMFLAPAYSQTEWSIVGNAVPGGTAVLKQNPANAQVFRYTGSLTNQGFKLSDGTNEYVPLCGESDPLGQTIDVRRATSSSDTGFRVRYTGTQENFKLTLTKNGAQQQLSVEAIDAPKAIYLMGGPINSHDPNWQLYDARELEPDPDNAFVFYYKGDLKYNTFGDEPGNFKLLVNRPDWNEAFHPAEDGNVLLEGITNMRFGGDDNKWFIPEDGSGDGYYVLKVDALNETLEVVSFEANSEQKYYPPAVYITGNAMPCNWTNEYPEIMEPIADQKGVYSWTGTVFGADPEINESGFFKFLKCRLTWDYCYTAWSPSEPIEFGEEYNAFYRHDDNKFVIPEDCDDCTITLDMRDPEMIKFVVTNNNQRSSVKTPAGEQNALVTVYNQQTKQLQISGENADATIRIFNMNGSLMLNRVLDSGITVSLPAGLYTVVMYDKNDIYRKKTIVY